jgi:hypothetical protein
MKPLIAANLPQRGNKQTYLAVSLYCYVHSYKNKQNMNRITEEKKIQQDLSETLVTRRLTSSFSRSGFCASGLELSVKQATLDPRHQDFALNVP